MRIVIVFGGNALFRRIDPMTTEVQRRNVKVAAQAIAPPPAEHSIVHGREGTLSGFYRAMHTKMTP